MNSASNVKPAPVVAKLLLLGDSGVGKSSIMSRFSDNYFDENMLSTSGVDFKSREWQVDDQRLKLTIWVGRFTFVRLLIVQAFHPGYCRAGAISNHYER